MTFEIDIPGDQGTLFVDNTSIASWPWATLYTGGTSSNTIGAVDFYAIGLGTNNALFYVDDITFTQTVVSVQEYGTGAHITVFPVPATDIVNITNERTERLDIRVYDITGQEVLPGSVMSNNSARHQLDVSALSTGVYFLELDNGEQTVVKRFTRE